MKVQLQTQQEEKYTATQLTRKLIKERGVLSLFNGISASMLRQMTYSTCRFGIYEIGKQYYGEKNVKNMEFHKRVILAGTGGLIAGFIGTPADMVGVRMQNDAKLPLDQQRNYKNAFDGLYRVYKEEGVRRLFTGANSHIARSVCMNIGQLTFYDEVKNFLISYQFKDNISTHFLASLMAGAAATTLSQPIDVIKTRMMNARPGQFSGIWAAVVYTAKLGPMGFYKGYFLRFIRLAPQTILIFVLLEQLRMNFGIEPKEKT